MYSLTLYTSIRFRNAVMVFTRSSAFDWDIRLSMKASSPNRNGTRTSVFFLNDTTPSFLIISARSEEHTSELQSLMRISYAVFCLKKKKKKRYSKHTTN